MSIHRRTFLQAGAGTLLAAMTHSCTQKTQQASTIVAKTNSLAAIQKRGYMIVATEDYYPPFEFVVNNKPTGYDYDLLQLLRKVAPFEIRQEILPWQGILPGVAAGEYDVALTAVGVTNERAKTLDFTMPIAESTVAYVKRKSDRSIQAVKDLSQKTIGVQQGGVSLAAVPNLVAQLKQQGGTLGTVKQYLSFADAYQDLINQRVDAVLHNIVSLSILVNEKRDIFELGERVSRKSYAAWAVQRGNQELLDFLNNFFVQIRNNGEMKKLQQKWLKVTFDDLPSQPLSSDDRL
jgi:polar amino acid transport system substrate-binding protein